jgi:hypothetical protein
MMGRMAGKSASTLEQLFASKEGIVVAAMYVFVAVVHWNKARRWNSGTYQRRISPFHYSITANNREEGFSGGGIPLGRLPPAAVNNWKCL